MNPQAWWARWVRRLAVADDAGMTLAELMVSMALTTVIMSLFTTGIVQLYQVSNVTQSREVAQSQVRTAWVRVEREVRYAAGITTPGQVGGDWYVEYVTTNTGPAVCGQLRLSDAAGQLQWRTWTRGQTPPTSWTVLASFVSEWAGVAPFRFYSANSFGGVQQLELLLTANVGSGKTAASKQIGWRITARNTSLQTETTKPADACIVRG
ncbi:MAG TPA: prepilin-type N-terminal cleavage/methylation domain-containing protein [Actinoplanes sp.]|nr:prepilin-type N-terminal cleavage/methylation domain-containing protein [Actinoplanes sp.]